MKVGTKQLIELSGILAVIASLVFVALELRENRLTSRAAAYQEIGIAVGASWQIAASDAELSEILLRANSLDPNVFGSLTDNEMSRARQFIVGSLRINEVLFLQVKEGLLDEEALDFLGFGDQLINMPVFQNIWPSAKSYVTPEFRDYLDRELDLR